MSLAAFLFIAQLAVPGAAEAAACALRPEAVRHAGEIIEFRGRYSSDGRERGRIDIVGCDQRYAVTMPERALALLIDPAMNPEFAGIFYPMRKVEAVFRARIDIVEPSVSSYQNDDGVRLTVLDVRDVAGLEQ